MVAFASPLYRVSIPENPEGIGARLDLSIHTVGEYVADPYQRFTVHSQTDWVRRFLVGDGVDRPSWGRGPERVTRGGECAGVPG